MTLNTQWKWRDGLITFYYNNYLIMMGGWNIINGVFTPGPSTNHIWISSDDGLNWTYLGAAPWSARHFCGHQIVGTTLYVFGGDPYIPAKDIWTYDLSQGILSLAVGANWTQQTSDWGVTGGDRDLYSHWVYNGKIRMAGGQIGFITPTMFTDVVELNTSTWTWDIVGTLPISYCSTAVTVQHGNTTYLYAGGRYIDGGGHDNLNTNLYKSLDGGSTWSLVSALPSEFDGLMYANGVSFGGFIWFLNGGGGVGNVGNKLGLWQYSISTDKWVKYKYSPLSRHASWICTDEINKMFIVSGNTRNDVIRITKNIL